MDNEFKPGLQNQIQNSPPLQPPRVSFFGKKVTGGIVAIILLVIGFIAYYHYRDLFTFSNQNNSTDQLNQKKIQASPKFSFLYITHGLINKTLQNPKISLYNPETKITQIIKQFGSEDQADVQPLNLNVSSAHQSGHFYYILSNSTSSSSIIKSDMHGNVLGSVSVNPAARYSDQRPAISPSGEKIAWCDKNGEITVYEPATKTTKSFKNEASCIRGAGGLTFSRDERKLYYRKGFYELYGDYSEQQLEDLNREAKNGYHEIDLDTGLDRIFSPYYYKTPVVFWDSPTINFDKKIIILPSDFDSATSTEVKRLADVGFDYLTFEQIQQLPTIAKLDLADRKFQEIVLSAQGDGLAYILRPEQGYGLSHEIGFLSFESNKNYFPISNISVNKDNEDYLRVVSVINKDSIFYSVFSRISKPGFPNPQSRTKFYKTTVDGQNELFYDGDIYTLQLVAS